MATEKAGKMKVQNDNFHNYENQFMASIAANLMFMSYGTMIGWMSPATELLMSKYTPLITGPISNDQLSWLASINAFGGIIGTLIFGFVALFLGCKNTIHTFALAPILFYTFIYYGETYYDILIARFLMGLGAGGIQTIIVLYVVEVSGNDIRGRLGTISHLSRNTGLLLAFIFGANTPYDVIPCIFILIPIVFAIWFAFFPNTPNYYLKRGNFQKAEEALRFYKRPHVGSDICEYEVQLKAEFDRLKFLANYRKLEEKICLEDIFNRQALLGILNGSVLAALACMSGFLVFATYAVVIFKESGARLMNPHISAMWMAVLQLIGNFCTAGLSDSVGRRALLFLSLLGSSCGMFTFSLYCYLRFIGFNMLQFEFVPVASLLFVVFISSAGVVPLMYLGMVEHIPFKIRTVGVTICNVVLNTVSFTILKMFPILMASIGLHATMLIFSATCSLGAIYVILVIDETKGISLESK